MDKLRRIISFCLAVVMLLGMVIIPSPINAATVNNKIKEVSYRIVDENGKQYKEYNLTDLVDINIATKVKKKNQRKNTIGIMAVGDLIPDAENYQVRVNWGAWSMSPDKLGTDVYFTIYDSVSKKTIAKTDMVTGSGLYKFKETADFSSPEVSADRSKWRVRWPNEVRFDIRLIAAGGSATAPAVFQADVTQKAMTLYRAEYYTNSSNPTLEVYRRNVENKIVKVNINDSNINDNQYYSFIKKPSRVYYEGKTIDVISAGVESDTSYSVNDINASQLVQIYTKVPGATNYDRGPGKFTDNGTPYHYLVTGDYEHPHIVTVRQDLKVNFDPNGAEWKNAPEKDQVIGHSMKLGDSWAGLGPINAPTASDIKEDTIPKKDEDGKKVDQKFVGWSRTKNGTAIQNMKEEVIKEDTTFYAVYAPKAQGCVAIQYVDAATTKAIDAKYHIDGQKYPDKAEGNVGEAVDINKIPQPVFYGYERTDTAIDVSGKTYQTDKVQTVEVEYKKLKDIIPAKDGNGNDNPDAKKPEVKNYYKKVVYKAEKVKGYLGEEAKDAEEVVYYVNPVAGKHVSEATEPNVGAKTGYLVDEANKWKYPEGISANTEITKDTASTIEITANFKKETIAKKFTKTWAADAGAKLPDTKPTVTFDLYADDVKVNDGGERILSNGATTAEYKNIPKYSYKADGSAEKEIKYTVKERGEANNSITLDGKVYAVQYTDAGVTNTLGKEVISITAKKVWAREDYAAKLPATKETVTFDLYKDGVKVDGQSKTLANGTTEVKWTGLDKYKADGINESAYTVKEAGTVIHQTLKIDTIILDGKTYEVQVSDLKNGVITVTNKLKKETTEFEATKVWAQAAGTSLPAVKPDVTFVLYKDGVATTTTERVGTDNKAKFTNLDKYTKDGDEIKYTVKEEGEAKGAVVLGGKDYTVTYSTDGKTVTNTLVKEQVEVKATKTWTEAKDVTKLAKNPEVKLQLLADGTAVAGKEVVVDAKGVADFGKVDKYQPNGTTEIEYTVKEVGEVDNKVKLGEREYKVTYNGLAVTNELQPKDIKVSYKFVTDKGAEITEDKVNKYLNPDSNSKEGKEIAAPTTPAVGTKVEIKKGTPEKLIGTYTFEGWEEAKITAKTEDITFVGVWKYVGEFYPIGKDITVQVGETPKPKDGIKNPKDAPDGTDYKFKEPIDTKTPGDKKAIVVVTIPNKEDHEHPRVEEVEIVVHVTDLRCMTQVPEINPVYDSDEYITGRGIAGAVIEVRYRDYPILRTKVDTFGEWEVYTPYPLEDEQFVYARQIKEPCDPSVWVSEEIRYDDEYWRKDDKKEEPKKPVEIKKVWTPAELNARDHFSYIKGYGDNTFGPNRTITRAEVAMIFARLSINQSVSGAPQFTDVKPGDWYRRAVDIVARQGVVKGYEDGTFRPNQPITRREFAAIAARYAGNIDAWRTFRDVPSTDWAYTLINRVGGAGWITGYEDNTFRPNNLITRAEVVAIVNRMLNRKADKAYVDNNLMRAKETFVDNMRSAWYFYDIYEAAVGHAFERQPNGVDEKWNRVTGQAFEIGKDVMYR